jgi:hypothetical protein
MGEIKVPRVDTLLDSEQALADIPNAMGYLLTRLLSLERGLLHAEYLRPATEVTWYVRPRGQKSEGEDVIAATLPGVIFSSMVARFALIFGMDYINGGRGEGVLVCEGRRFAYRVFLSRCDASGYWIRLYAEEVGADPDVVTSSDFLEATD